MAWNRKKINELLRTNDRSNVRCFACMTYHSKQLVRLANG